MQLAGAVQQFLFIESVSPKPSIWRSERNSSRETVELEKRAADAADLTFLTCSGVISGMYLKKCTACKAAEIR